MKWLYHCVIILIALEHIDCQYPPFLQGLVDTLPQEDDVVETIYLPSPLPFGNESYHIAHISSNGLISFGQQIDNHHHSNPFPITVPALAAFWDDIDLTEGGAAQYAVLDSRINTDIADDVDEYLWDLGELEFNTTNMLIARWSNVCEYQQYPYTSNCSLAKNSFQVIVATDGSSSYAIFTYQCNAMQWGAYASVGFGARSDFFFNSEYVNDNVTCIDCLNENFSNWTNMVLCVSDGCRNSTIMEGLQSGENYLPFIDLYALPSANRINSSGFGEIRFPFAVPFGIHQYRIAYVNGNGVISFGSVFNDFPALFPIEVPVVTSFWTTQSSEQLHSTPHRKYAIIDILNGAGMISHIEEYLRSNHIKLNVTMAVTARWNNTIISNSEDIFYVTIVTDGTTSYAILTYRCGQVNWYNGDTVIGFSAMNDFYANHNYSLTGSVTDIDCINEEWTHIVYYVGGPESCQVPCNFEGSCSGVEQCNCTTEKWIIPECGAIRAATVDYYIIVIIVLITLIALAVVIVLIAVIIFVKRRQRALLIHDINNSIILGPRTSNQSITEDFTEDSNYKLGALVLKEVPKADVVPGARLKLLAMIGKGEFGVVYRALLNPSALPQPVAAKTIKDCQSTSDIDDIINECAKMTQFNHPNVLPLIGVCVDLGPAPYIIMPFMAKGSLLAYLVKERHNLTLTDNIDINVVLNTRKELLSMCLQVAKGMEYLVQQGFLHRDLAARNCLYVHVAQSGNSNVLCTSTSHSAAVMKAMIDNDNKVKISDFGLSENVYMRRYHQQQDTTQKLPVKWMAIESLHKGLFSEKSDVWSFGVVCWEVFTSGNIPYPGSTPQDVIDLLGRGNRLPPPENAASSDEIYQMMSSCWKEGAEERPSFASLVSTVEALMSPLAEYLSMKFE